MSRFNKQIKKTEAELLKAEETVSNLKEKLKDLLLKREEAEMQEIIKLTKQQGLPISFLKELLIEENRKTETQTPVKEAPSE